LLYLNGESLLKVPFWKRRKLLQEVFKETLGFAHAQSVGLATFDDELLRATLEQAVTDGAEGLMIKLTGEGYHAPNADVSCRTFGYESGTRSQLWLKLKRDYVVGYADTIDVVPIGAWYGNGRKAQKGFLSPILFAVYDEDEGAFRSISRCMSFTDAMYQGKDLLPRNEMPERLYLSTHLL
jgi:DNA ligase-1